MTTTEIEDLMFNTMKGMQAFVCKNVFPNIDPKRNAIIWVQTDRNGLKYITLHVLYNTNHPDLAKAEMAHTRATALCLLATNEAKEKGVDATYKFSVHQRMLSQESGVCMFSLMIRYSQPNGGVE